MLTADLRKNMMLTTDQTKNIRHEKRQKSLQKANLQKSKSKSWLCLLVYPQQ